MLMPIMVRPAMGMVAAIMGMAVMRAVGVNRPIIFMVPRVGLDSKQGRLAPLPWPQAQPGPARVQVG